MIAARLGADFTVDNRSRQSTLIASQTSRSTAIVHFSAFMGSAVVLFGLGTVHVVVHTICRHTQLPFSLFFVKQNVFMSPTVVDCTFCCLPVASLCPILFPFIVHDTSILFLSGQDETDLKRHHFLA